MKVASGVAALVCLGVGFPFMGGAFDFPTEFPDPEPQVTSDVTLLKVAVGKRIMQIPAAYIEDAKKAELILSYPDANPLYKSINQAKNLFPGGTVEWDADAGRYLVRDVTGRAVASISVMTISLVDRKELESRWLEHEKYKAEEKVIRERGGTPPLPPLYEYAHKHGTKLTEDVVAFYDFPSGAASEEEVRRFEGKVRSLVAGWLKSTHGEGA